MMPQSVSAMAGGSAALLAVVLFVRELTLVNRQARDRSIDRTVRTIRCLALMSVLYDGGSSSCESTRYYAYVESRKAGFPCTRDTHPLLCASHGRHIYLGSGIMYY